MTAPITKATSLSISRQKPVRQQLPALFYPIARIGRSLWRNQSGHSSATFLPLQPSASASYLSYLTHTIMLGTKYRGILRRNFAQLLMPISQVNEKRPAWENVMAPIAHSMLNQSECKHREINRRPEAEHSGNNQWLGAANLNSYWLRDGRFDGVDEGQPQMR